VLTLQQRWGRFTTMRWLTAHAAAARSVGEFDTMMSLAEATEAGLGIGLLPHGVAVRSGRLVPLALPAAIEPTRLTLVYHPDMRTDGRIRALVTAASTRHASVATYCSMAALRQDRGAANAAKQSGRVLAVAEASASSMLRAMACRLRSIAGDPGRRREASVGADPLPTRPRPRRPRAVRQAQMQPQVLRNSQPSLWAALEVPIRGSAQRPPPMRAWTCDAAGGSFDAAPCRSIRTDRPARDCPPAGRRLLSDNIHQGHAFDLACVRGQPLEGCTVAVELERLVGDQLDLDVVAVAAVEHVDARPAEQHVIAGTAEQHVVAVAADQHIVAVAAVRREQHAAAARPDASMTSSPPRPLITSRSIVGSKSAMLICVPRPSTETPLRHRRRR